MHKERRTVGHGKWHVARTVSMRLAWRIGLAGAAACVLAGTPAKEDAAALDVSWSHMDDAQLVSLFETRYSPAEGLNTSLATLRSLLDEAHVDVELPAAPSAVSAAARSLARVGDALGLRRAADGLRRQVQVWTLRHQQVYAHSEHGKAVYTGPLRKAIAIVAHWIMRPAPEPQRPPYTYYDATDQWPDWDFDAARAAVAAAAHKVQPVTNGWEQAMWGPFVEGLAQGTVPAMQAVQDAYDAAPKERALLFYFRKGVQSLLKNAEMPSTKEDETSATQRRALAIRLLEWVAFSGDSEELEMRTTDVQRDALWILGEHSLWGTHGASPNISRAICSFEQLAASGNATAHARLGFLYSSPLMEGVYNTSTHLDRALLHYTMAAKQGERHAELALASRYRFGLGVKQNCTKALYHYERQANKSYELSTAVIGGRVPSYSKWSIYVLEGIVRRTRAIPTSLYYNLLERDAYNLLERDTNIFRVFTFDKDLPLSALNTLKRYPTLLREEPVRHHLLEMANAGQIHDAGLLYSIARALYHGSFVSQSETIGAFPRNLTKSAQFAEQITRRLWPRAGTEKKQSLNHDEQVIVIKAAEQLGMQYLRGEGVAQNPRAAHELFTRIKEMEKEDAVSFHTTRASHGLALISIYGAGGYPPDKELALKHLKEYDTPGERAFSFAPRLDLEIANLYLKEGDFDSARNRMAHKLESISILDMKTYGYPRVERPYIQGVVRKDSFMNDKGNLCDDVVEAFQEAAERGDWEDPIYHRGTAAYARNDIPRALLAFAIAADTGMWEGQVNSAYLLDQST